MFGNDNPWFLVIGIHSGTGVRTDTLQDGKSLWQDPYRLARLLVGVAPTQARVFKVGTCSHIVS